MRKKRLVIVILIFSVPIVLISYFHFLIMQTAHKTPPSHVPYVIVLGAKVNGEQMSLSLYNRAQTASKYLNENNDTKVIVTGGQGPGENITEAEALKRYFIKEGIDESRILVEDRSTSTYENLLFTKNLFEIDEAIIVSNDFHLYRSIQLAKKIGMKGHPLAAETPSVVKTQLFVREYAAIFKMKLFGR